MRPTGAVTLFATDGSPVGILHASTLTAFRTALASACLLIRRNKVRTITVFGAGQQAYWHIRLALMLRGRTIQKVNIINRMFSDGCKLVLKRFYNTPAHIKDREGWRDATFHVLTPGYGEYARLLRDQVLAADVIFCCTPSTEPLFDGSILTSHEGRRRGRLIVAIGSYTPEMREVPLELLQQATRSPEGHFHYHKHAVEGGVVVVDTLDGALKEAGEIIEAGLLPTQLVEYVASRTTCCCHLERFLLTSTQTRRARNAAEDSHGGRRRVRHQQCPQRTGQRNYDGLGHVERLRFQQEVRFVEQGV